MQIHTTIQDTKRLNGRESILSLRWIAAAVFSASLALICGCTVTKGLSEPPQDLVGYIEVHNPTILFYNSREDKDTSDWGRCQNVVAKPAILTRAKGLQERRVRIKIELIDNSLPEYSDSDNYYRRYFRGVPVSIWCRQAPLFWARSIKESDAE